MVNENQISNTEVKNFIEHSFKIIISSFNDRLERIELRLSELELSLRKGDYSTLNLPETAKLENNRNKKTETNLSDALKLIGHE